jgi:hypothetical protein
MDNDLLNRRDDLSRDHQLRRELDDASPTVGSAGLLIGAIILLLLGIVFFGSPAGERTQMASGDTVEAAAPVSPQTSP